ncbi:MAG: hypothetical protein JWM55_491 [Acidimicrobiaceae bacterium]|nr:hypothetical protein [Acidimicrobiaceae bacterium]
MVFIVLIFAIPVMIGSWIVATYAKPASVFVASCRAVSATRANGFDPDVDRLGYAEAQARPLQEIATPHAGLNATILQLSSAYQPFYNDKSAAPSSELVSMADKNDDRSCPRGAS